MGIKTKTVCVKKQRKQPSKAAAAAASEQHDAESGDGEGDILAVREGEAREDRGAISMESMVCLPDPATTPIFHEAIARLKYGNYKQAGDSLLKIIR